MKDRRATISFMRCRSSRTFSSRQRRMSFVVIGCAVFVAGALACGPFLPEQVLISRRVVLRTPVGDFAREVTALDQSNNAAPALPQGIAHTDHPSKIREWDWDEAHPAKQLDIELQELGAALDHSGMPESGRPALLEAYKAYRADVVLHDRSTAVDETSGAVRFDARIKNARQGAKGKPNPVGVPSTVSSDLPEALLTLQKMGLPTEWVDYLEGAYRFEVGDLPGAQSAWDRLLARPQSERLYRSTWAAFMLARMLDDDTPAADNKTRYSHVRELRAAGCLDGLNLAAASLGWEGRLALRAKDFSAAARLYYLQAQGGLVDKDSLRDVADAALGKGKGDPVTLASARDPFLRRVVTLYVACSRDFSDSVEPTAGPAQTPEPTSQPTPDATPANPLGDPFAPAEKSARECSGLDWLSALNNAGVDYLNEAQFVAWAAYQQGDYVQARDWLNHCPADQPLALWLHGKLALRDGHNDEAAKNFAEAVRAFPVDPATDNAIDWSTERARSGHDFRSQQFQMDYGIVQLSRGDCKQALSCLLRSGFWRDAAYVAEEVLTLDELVQYVRERFPTAPSPREPKPGESVDDAHSNEAADAMTTIKRDIDPEMSSDRAAFSLRYVLARRLARAGRYADARRFYPSVLLPKFDEYVAARKLADTVTAPKPQRAESLWRAAKIERWLGMELFGTENGPDWFVDDGAFEEENYRAARLGVAAGPTPTLSDAPQPSPPYVPLVGAEEKHRIAKEEVNPPRRYHYRYLAADLAWKAAAIMPDEQVHTAQVLAAGGQWLESVDETKASDRFYTALLRRCGRTDIGREADKSGKIPDVPHEDP